MKQFKKNNTGAIACLGLSFALAVMTSMPSSAEVFDPTFGNAITSLQIPINHSRVLNLDQTVESVTVGNPDVADIQVLDPQRIHVVAKSLGSTNVVISTKGGKNNYSTFTVDVTHDLNALKRVLHEIMPEEKPEIRSAQGAIIIAGEVSSPAKVLAIDVLAKQFVKDAKKFEKKAAQGAGAPGESSTEVVNLMQVGGPHQVMLEVKVAEVSRNVLKRLGINLAGLRAGRPWHIGAVNGGASFPNALTSDKLEVPIFPRTESWLNANDPVIGPMVREIQPSVPAISAAGLFMSFLSSSSYFSLIIDASKEDGLAKILAEPTLTTLSGEAASFLSGGEFPIPVWTGGSDGRITVVFKEFGISVKFLPTVLDSKRVNLALNVSVSELMDAANLTASIPGSTSSFNIPALSTRSANSTVELMDGETIGIAGLISDKMRETITKFPGLGDLPILGALFRSQQFVQDQTELVMFVTAHLAKPISPNNIRLPTDAFSAPSDLEFFLFGRMEGASAKADKNSKLDSPTPEDALPNQPDSKAGPTFGHQL